jgi:phosphoserine phosphatase RsbU/P
MLRDGRVGLFVTALFMTLELASGQLAFASAGHDLPLLVRGARRRSQLLTARSTILGAFRDIDLEDRRIELAAGDALVLYTDGVTEARDRRGRLFGERRLRAVVMASVGGSAERTAHAVLDAVTDFAGDVPLPDDLTLVVAKRLDRPS